MYLGLACWVKIPGDVNMKYFSYFSQKKASTLQANCLKCESLFSWKNKKNIISLLSKEFAHIVVKVNEV